MISIDRAIIVEGKYDKIRLSSVVDAVIICTDGFRIFKDSDKMRLIRHYAKAAGIIILTDSDTAGFKIRGFLKGAVNEGNIVNVYIPDIFGKERRKKNPSKEGKLGVEGMDEKILLDAFSRAGVTSSEKKQGDIDKALLFELGLSGAANASEKRRRLLHCLELPEHMTSNALAEVLNTIMTADRLRELAADGFDDNIEKGGR